VPALQLQVATASPSFIVSKHIEHCMEPGTFTIQCLAHPLLPTSVLCWAGIGAAICMVKSSNVCQLNIYMIVIDGSEYAESMWRVFK